MARVILIAIEDNAMADSFVRQVMSDGFVWQLPPSKPDIDYDIPQFHPNEGRRVNCMIEAVVARPTSWCRCAVPEVRGRRKGKREIGWSRSTHFGWWVCVTCGKPSSAIVRHFITTMLAGCNDLVPEILRIGKPITPHQRWIASGGLGEARHHNVRSRTEF